MSNEIQNFVSFIRSDTKQNNTRIRILSQNKSLLCIENNIKDHIYGYFRPPTTRKCGLIVIAGGVSTPEVLHTLAHEYVHFLQWRRNDPIYDCTNYRKLERYTEQEAIKLLRAHKVPINLVVVKKKSKRYLKSLD